jgi:hypothetical protein
VYTHNERQRERVCAYLGVSIVLRRGMLLARNWYTNVDHHSLYCTLSVLPSSLCFSTPYLMVPLSDPRCEFPNPPEENECTMCAEKRGGADDPWGKEGRRRHITYISNGKDDPWGKSRVAAVSVMCGVYPPCLRTYPFSYLQPSRLLRTLPSPHSHSAPFAHLLSTPTSLSSLPHLSLRTFPSLLHTHTHARACMRTHHAARFCF